MGNIPVTEALGRSGSYNMSPPCEPHEVETLSSVDLDPACCPPEASRARGPPPPPPPTPVQDRPSAETEEDVLSSRSVAEKARHFNLKVEEVSESTKRSSKSPEPSALTPTRTIAIQTELREAAARRDSSRAKVPIVRWNTLECSPAPPPPLHPHPHPRHPHPNVVLQRSSSIPDAGQTGLRRLIPSEVARSRFETTPRGKPGRASLRREKSLQQRREEERQIQKSRELTNSYELSSDLKNKQVEMLEKRYGGRRRAQHAAKVIQDAFRQHSMKKEFQRLRRTPSESRISRYLDSHSKQWGMSGSRARVMVIGQAGPASPNTSPRPPPPPPPTTLAGIQELGAVEQLREIAGVSAGGEKKKHKAHHHHQSNNSNNVTPKRRVPLPGETQQQAEAAAAGIKADGDASSAERARKTSKTVVLTLTMHRQSDEGSSDSASHTSADSTPLGSHDDLSTKAAAAGGVTTSTTEITTTTERTVKMVVQNTQLRDGGGRAFACRLGGPIAPASPGQVACTKKLNFDELGQELAAEPEVGPSVPEPGAAEPSVRDTSTLDTSTLDTSGLDTSGLDTSGLDTSGLDTSRLDTSGLDTSGLDTSGLDTSGLDTSGLDTGGLDTSQTIVTEESDLSQSMGSMAASQAFSAAVDTVEEMAEQDEDLSAAAKEVELKRDALLDSDQQAPMEQAEDSYIAESSMEESCVSPAPSTPTSPMEGDGSLVSPISTESRKTVLSKAVIKDSGTASPSTKRSKKSLKGKGGDEISPKKKNWPFSRSKSGDRTRRGSPTNSPKLQRHSSRGAGESPKKKQGPAREEAAEGSGRGKSGVDSPPQPRKASSSSGQGAVFAAEPDQVVAAAQQGGAFDRPRVHTVGSIEALARKKSAQELEKLRSNSLSGGDLLDRSDQISLASTLTTSDFDQDSVQDVPAVTVATPEGSLTMLDKIGAADSDSEEEDLRTPQQKRASLPHVSLSGHTASSPPASASKQLVSRVQSASGMESPIWKRKSQTTKVAGAAAATGARNGTLVNGTAGAPAKTLARSETGDSMSSESSTSSSRFMVGEDGSITDSMDSLSLESSFMECMEKRPMDTMLSIPMTAVRWRRYRIGLNLFNKKPEKGIKFLVDNKFVENSPNEVAKFLLHRTGLSKSKIGEYLGNLQKEFNMLVLECFVDEMNFRDMCIDDALRKFQTAFRLPGEAQKIERLMEAFAQRYCICNGDVARAFQKPDTIFILAFAIIMLNTDLHSPNVKPERRMKLQDFMRNLSGIDDGHDVDPELLRGIYDRIQHHPFQPGMDHTSIVFKIEQNITGNRPILAETHRRLVRDCSLSEVYDPTKKDKKHPRHVFLFNDMLMVTKLYKKKTGSIYGFKKSFPLHTACVLDFSSQHYPHGIRLVASMNKRTLITFCANSQEEKMKFVADLRETVMEVNEMEDIRIGAELERQKIARKSQASTADSGLGLDTESFASTQNLSGSMDSLAPQPADTGSLKRSALSNSLMDLKEASSKKNHRNSASSLDSGVTLDINATMPLPRKKRSGSNPVSAVFNARHNKVTQPSLDLSTAGSSDNSDS